MRFLARSILLTALLLALACGDDATNTPVDSGTTLDSATDGGVATDASMDAAMDATRPMRDSGPPPPPPPTIEYGDAMTAADGVWTFVDFPGTTCMDGSATGLGLNLSSTSDDVVIYFQGGNLCFDALSCIAVANPDGFTAAKLNPAVNALANGIFDRTDPDNPVADWNFVFVPYCSGDIHTGNQPSGYMGNANLGYGNTTQFLGRVVPTFSTATKVLVTGSSAGGFGAIANFHQAVSAFEARSSAKLYLLDDAGPPMSDTYLRPCFQQKIRDAFGLDSIPLMMECTNCSRPDGGGLGNMIPFLADAHPELRMAMLSTTGDSTIRQFYSYGYSHGCNLPVNMPEADYEAGLIEERDVMLAGRTNFKFFLQRETFHTFLGRRLESAPATVNGVTLAEWIRRLVEDDVSWDNLGP